MIFCRSVLIVLCSAAAIIIIVPPSYARRSVKVRLPNRPVNVKFSKISSQKGRGNIGSVKCCNGSYCNTVAVIFDEVNKEESIKKRKPGNTKRPGAKRPTKYAKPGNPHKRKKKPNKEVGKNNDVDSTTPAEGEIVNNKDSAVEDGEASVQKNEAPASESGSEAAEESKPEESGGDSTTSPGGAPESESNPVEGGSGNSDTPAIPEENATPTSAGADESAPSESATPESNVVTKPAEEIGSTEKEGATASGPIAQTTIIGQSSGSGESSSGATASQGATNKSEYSSVTNGETSVFTSTAVSDAKQNATSTSLGASTASSTTTPAITSTGANITTTKNSTTTARSTTAGPTTTTKPCIKPTCDPSMFAKRRRKKRGAPAATDGTFTRACNKSYFFGANPVSWSESFEACKGFGMVSVGIGTTEKQKCVSDAANSNPKTSNKSYWINGHKKGATCPKTYAMCDANEVIGPDLSQLLSWAAFLGEDPDKDLCLTLALMAGAPTGLSHAFCEKKLNFMCEPKCLKPECPADCKIDSGKVDAATGLALDRTQGNWIETAAFYYYFITTAENWNTAWDVCCKYGMKLVGLETPAKVTDLLDALQKTQNKAVGNYWVSGSQHKCIGVYHFCDSGIPVEKSDPWLTGKPDNAVGNAEHIYVQLAKASVLMSDESENTKFRPLCVKPK